jgi:two-component system CheB/CheR fusion protein
MNKKETRLGGAADLRKKAEKITREKAALPPGNIEKKSPAEINRMLHELQVHQVELELQNEELFRAQAELDVAGSRFFDFYDLAPVGYFTLSEKGLILEANLTAAKMLGMVRRELVSQPLSNFILPEDMDIYYLQHKQLFENTSASSGQAGKTQVYELRMVKNDGATFWVRLDTIAANNTDGALTCRIVISNINDSKRAEKELSQSLKLLRYMIESPQSIIIFSLDSNLRYMAFNSIHQQTMKEIWGVDIRPGMNMLEVIGYESDRKAAQQNFQRALSGEQFTLTETYGDDALSRRVWENTYSPIYDENNQIIGLTVYVIDITNRKQEDALERARKELAAIKISGDIESQKYAEGMINTVREPLIVLDQDLRVVTASRSFYEFFKVSPEDTEGQLIYDLGNKQWNIPKLRELLETILPQKATFDNYEVEHDFTTIGKRIMLLNARQIQRVSGKEKIILLAIEDITERKEIEAGLEKTRKELADIKILADETSEFTESIINTVREPLISLDQNLRVVNASRSFYEFFKVKPEDTVGQLIYDLGNKQWNIPKLRELLETILPQKATFDNYEVEHNFTTIGKRIMLLNARQIQRVLGKEKIILLAIEDITERKEIEAGLEKAHEELQELTRELKRAAKVKSEFLANMSHELRTPLNSINGFSEVLYDETFGSLNEKQKKYVSNVLSSGKHLLLLINQILDMAKIEAGKMQLALSNLLMKSLLNEIAMLVADMVSKKKLEMLLEIAEDLPNIDADELKVKEIIYNLLSNAVKFTPEGGKIGMQAKKVGSDVEIVVWDNGIGIASENMEKIFEGFFRVDTPYSRLTEGTGLGLPLSRKMVEMHSGKLTVVSKGLNKGTSVAFTLPIVSIRSEVI